MAQRERDLEEKYDFRYSQLLFVFARLVAEGRLQEEQFDGLDEDKRMFIGRVLALAQRG